jgi:hypothetical protein
LVPSESATATPFFQYFATSSSIRQNWLAGGLGDGVN